MTIKNAIAIGKGLGHLVKVDDASGVDTTFRSYLRLLVDIDVCKPLNPGFPFTRNDGTATWVCLKYERLDVYCIDYGMLGHKQFFFQAPQVDRFPTGYKISLKVTIFSNLLSSSPTAHHEKKKKSINLFPLLCHKIEPTQPCVTIPQPHAKQLETLPNPHNSLTPPTTISLVPYP
jgi:hypothetical protein